ncbi:MAG: hypothetical protein MUE81_15170, partial [Thermoflexibacter sp.]|nr:hypothetical protein [Thermoflexibacter sp.]
MNSIKISNTDTTIMRDLALALLKHNDPNYDSMKTMVRLIEAGKYFLYNPDTDTAKNLFSLGKSRPPLQKYRFENFCDVFRQTKLSSKEINNRFEGWEKKISDQFLKEAAHDSFEQNTLSEIQKVVYKNFVNT